ncbi:MAG: tRNA pseudouridine(38-40) synthase TruA [Chlamydiia bacterium]|nr:tRNA pseudouridine(38-40) synthase TruA [Chlamydiia bacterium]
MKYKMTLSYDGTAYGGWQIQPNRITIQEVIQKALCHPITGSGRTDAGVHALEQVAHFSSDTPVEVSPINALLPPDIRIHSISPVGEDFHARYSVKKKIYHYRCSWAQNPFHYRYCTPIQPLDLDLLKEALPLLIGTHDFSTFRGAGCGSKEPVKTLYRLDLVPEKGGFRLEFEGNGFLYKMVRNIVGTLLEIATQKRALQDLSILLSSKDRTLAGPTAPPQGLILFKVVY